MILLVGASASGKTEIAKYLKTKYGILKAITTTTRTPRVGETDGVDYFFLSKPTFEEKAKQKFFVETTFYNGNYYGCGKDQIDDNKCVILDPNGLNSFLALNNPSLISFFIDCDPKIRRQRMIDRGDSEQKAEERIKTDSVVFSTFPKTSFVIKNESSSLDEIASLIYKLYTEKLNQSK